MHFSLWNAFVIGFAIAAAVYDLRWHKIPRGFNLIGFVAGLLFHAIYGRLLDAVQCALVAFALGMILYSVGAIGGGDVKLMTALGAMMGLYPWLHAMLIAIFVAAAMALVQVIRRGVWRQTLSNMGEIVMNLGRRGLEAHPVINVKNPAMIRSPFGVAAAIGVLAAVFTF